MLWYFSSIINLSIKFGSKYKYLHFFSSISCIVYYYSISQFYIIAQHIFIQPYNEIGCSFIIFIQFIFGILITFLFPIILSMLSGVHYHQSEDSHSCSACLVSSLYSEVQFLKYSIIKY